MSRILESEVIVLQLSIKCYISSHEKSDVVTYHTMVNCLAAQLPLLGARNLLPL